MINYFVHTLYLLNLQFHSQNIELEATFKVNALAIIIRALTFIEDLLLPDP